MPADAFSKVNATVTFGDNTLPTSNAKTPACKSVGTFDKRKPLTYNFTVRRKVENSGFFEKVYKIVETIPVGKVATYGQIARLCGSPRAARQVGWALHVNPRPFVVPCHRVVNKSGRIAPSFAFGGEDVQRNLLLQEGVTFTDQNTVDLKKHLWEK